jgi:hypothetical protein
MERITKFFSRSGLGTKLELIVVLLILVGAIITLSLGGSVKPSTIQIVHSPNPANVYGETMSNVLGYSDNFTGWVIGYKSPSASGQIRNSPSALFLNGSFGSYPSATSVAIFKNLGVNITAYPILSVDLSLNTGIGYGIRFFAEYPDGTQYNIWWEASPLDHRPGQGSESLRVNMEREATLATGHSVGNLTRMEIYLEVGTDSPKNFQFTLANLAFETFSLQKVSNNNYSAVYFDLAQFPRENASWYLNKVNIGATIKANASSVFSIYIVNGTAIFGSPSATGLAFNPLTPSSQYTFYPKLQPQIFTELLPLSNMSIIFVTSSGALQDVTLNSVDFEFLPTTQIPSISQQSLGLYYVYFIFFLFLLPVGIAILVFREFLPRSRVPKASIATVFGFGLLCRIALATATAHVFDINVYLTSTRGWFQFRDPAASLGPTLPFTFFLYWIGYSPYAILQLAGFQDVQFLGHAAGIVEGVFVRLFPIAMDALIFFLLFRFRRNGPAFVWATFYFLNPLAIFISSVWGQYEAASIAFVVWGIHWMSRQRVTPAALAFVASGMIELIGFFPYVLLLLRTARMKLYKTLLFATLGVLPVVLYHSEADLIFRILLGLIGLTSGQFSGPGIYNLLGSFPQLSVIMQIKPLLLSEAIVLGGALLETYRQRMSVERLVFYIALSFVFLLLFANLLASWVWLLPVCLLYALMKGKNDLGAFMLVFGTMVAFLIVSNTTGSAYLLLGNVGVPILPAIEAIPNRLQIFTVMVTSLAIILLLLLRFGSGSATQTMLRTSALALSIYVLLYFWLGVYPS